MNSSLYHTAIKTVFETSGFTETNIRNPNPGIKTNTHM